MAVSVLLSLGAAELLAGARVGFARPYLTLFEADPRYGVRLRAGASARLRSRGGGLTGVSVNSAGFRGPEWSVPGGAGPVAGRVLLVGDSQAFGYHVAFEDSLAAALSRTPGGALEVFPAAVPSWGPSEYALAVQELVPRYRPSTVVVLATVANDLREATTSNSARTTARDGWAVRVVAGAEPPTPFPGREWLLGQSQLVLAVRTLLAHGSGDALGFDGPGRVLDQADRLGKARPGHESALGPHLAAMQRLCALQGCELVVAVLPLDVQADPGAWAKHREAPRDTRALDALAAPILADAAAAGAIGVDLLETLRAVSPGAYLSDDPHLSAKGHAAVAGVIARATTPPLSRLPSEAHP